jgi:hypothetical protein
MDTRLEQARAILRGEADKRNNKSASSSGNGGDNASYAFWDIPENTSATLRFVPDANDSNPWFWVERQIIRLPFHGVVGGDYPSDKTVSVTVPCVDMFGDTCPIIAETRPWWKDDSKKDLARTYYKKRSYIAQGFVVASPFEEAVTPVNPIRRFILGASLIEKIKTGLADPDMEFFPTDYANGVDFRVRKTRKGEYNNYDTSEWARRSRALTETERLAIEQYGLNDLKTFLGTRPESDGIAVIKALFHASLNGEPFDHTAYGKYYRPYGGSGSRSEEAIIDPMLAATLAKTTAVVATGNDGDGTEPLDLLTKLRTRAATR